MVVPLVLALVIVVLLVVLLVLELLVLMVMVTVLMVIVRMVVVLMVMVLSVIMDRMVILFFAQFHGPRGHGARHGFKPLFKGLMKAFGLKGKWKCGTTEKKCHKGQEKCRRSESVQPQCRRVEGQEVRGCRRSQSTSGARSFSKCHGYKKCQRYKKSELNAEFIKDVNYPDGSIVSPGITLIKQWQVKNTSAMTWPEGSKLIFLRGNRELLGEEEEFNVPLAQPDQIVDISCPINVPLKSGGYSAYFKLADKDRNVFGRRFWIEFTVSEEKNIQKPAPISPKKESKKEITEDKKEDGKVTFGINSTIPIPTVPVTTTVPQTTSIPVPSTPSSVPEVPSKYSTALGVLERMGFVNQQLNISLLERGKGNLEQVVTWLLEMENVAH